MRLAPVPLIALALAACQQEDRSEAPPQAAMEERLARARAELDAPFVVFTRNELVIDRLGAPAGAPVTVGSRPSGETMASEDPGIVEVLADGQLIGRKPGRTRIRALGSAAVLEVAVVAPGARATSPQEQEEQGARPGNPGAARLSR